MEKELSKTDKWAHDERILGSGSLVESVLKKAEPVRTFLSLSNEERQERFAQLVQKICVLTDYSIEELTSGGRRRELVKVRRSLCFLAVRKLGMTSAAVARQLNLSGVAVLKAVEVGKQSIEELGLTEEKLL